MQISVVIPAYNEAKTIGATLDEVKGFLQNRFEDFEIIVVDDKSQDSTLEIVRTFDGVKVIRNLKNHGKGYTVAKGVMAARGEWILFMDADNSTKISELDNFLKHINDYKIIIASRALPESDVAVSQNFVKEFLGKAGNFLIRSLLCIKVKDTQCGYKLFHNTSKFIFDKITIEDWGFDFELIFLAKKYKFKVKELPITWVNNFDSKVKWYIYFKAILQVFKVRWNNLLGRYN